MKVMKKKVLLAICTFAFVLIFNNNYSYGFKNGAVMNIYAEVGGSATMPSINEDDLKLLGTDYMSGMVGFVPAGIIEIGYIFGVEEHMGFENDNIFSGVGLFGYIGVGEGYAGQSSGLSLEEDSEETIDVFFNVYYTPVIAAGITGKAYFFKNRMAIGISVGVKVIADTQPVYEMYSTETDLFPPTVGTIIVDEWMMNNMNAVSLNFRTEIEYNVPILDTVEFILGAFFGGNIYTPTYITMPPDLLEAAYVNNGFTIDKALESYYINSLEFGIKAGLGLKL